LTVSDAAQRAETTETLFRIARHRRETPGPDIAQVHGGATRAVGTQTKRISTMTTKFGDNSSETLNGTESADWINGGGGNDYIDGHGGDDVLDGGSGADTVYGGGGNDRIYALADGADDYLDGGWDTDTIDYSAINNGIGIVISLNKGYAQCSTIGHDTLVGFENAVGTQAGDIIHGTDPGFLGFGGNDGLYGEGGNDFINGHGGDDWIRGGDGLDDLKGGDGNDTLHGDNDTDHLYGGAGDDWLYGDAGSDTLNGGTGLGSNMLSAGINHFDGGDGFDTVSYEDYTEGVNIFAEPEPNPYFINILDTFVNVEKIVGSNFDDYIVGDRLGVGSNNVLDGGDGDDWLYGDDETNHGAGTGIGGNDQLYGGSGDDYLKGGNGVDLLTGGFASDRFEFFKSDSGVGAGNRDVVTDFEPGLDHLVLHTPGESLNFVGQSSFKFADQVRFAFEGNDTIVQLNLDSDAIPEMEIQLSGQVFLTASDFYFYS
jgi:Ca2+-binding RTX toxin-like protein